MCAPISVVPFCLPPSPAAFLGCASALPLPITLMVLALPGLPCCLTSQQAEKAG